MIEIVMLIIALAGIGDRAYRRGMPKVGTMLVAGLGWGVIFVLSMVALGPAGLFLRWIWLAGVYVFVHLGAKVGDTWQCPDCRMFNDGGTLVCPCGHVHPDAPPGTERTE